MLRSPCSCIYPADRTSYYGKTCHVGRLDLQSPYLPCNQLSMCVGHQHPVKFLRRNRWSQQSGHSGQGFQLSGNTGSDKICCIWQNRYYDSGCLRSKWYSSQWNAWWEIVRICSTCRVLFLPSDQQEPAESIRKTNRQKSCYWYWRNQW